jgi:hypothetical protein
MFTFLQSPPGHRIASSPCMPIASYTLRECLSVSPEIFMERKSGFLKSKLHSTAFIDDSNKKHADHRAKFYLMPPYPSKDEIHPPGNQGPSISNVKGMKFSILSIFNSTTQVVPTSLPSRDAYKTFICKGLFTTTHAIQKGSITSPVEKAYLEPMVTRFRSYFERFWLPDRNSVPGSTGIGLVPSLRTLFMELISPPRKFLALIYSNLVRYCFFNIFSIQCGLKLTHQKKLIGKSANFKPFYTPMMQESINPN